MNGELILDAMNLLDDDLIEETGKLRGKKRNSYWYIVVAVAACLCLFVFSGRGQSMAPTEADMNGNSFSNITGESKLDPEMEAPMASAETFVSVIRITEVGEDHFSGIIENEDSGDEEEETVTIFCSPEVIPTLSVGDTVKAVYDAGSNNWLLELSLIRGNE